MSHIGALRALEGFDEFEIRGTAGTSAGAIVACLIALGYSADEVYSFNADTGEARSLFDNLETANSPSDLLRPRHWRRLQRLRAIWQYGPVAKLKLLGFLIVLGFLPYVGEFFAPPFCDRVFWGNLVCYGFDVLYVILISSLILAGYYFAKNFDGAASLDDLIGALDVLLRQKVDPSEGGRVTFSDLKSAGITLKVVASNITSRELTLFSTDNARVLDVAVADAVAASCAIPFVFRPVRILGDDFCDGGMVSNLPAWTFGEQIAEGDEPWLLTSEITSPVGHTDLEQGRRQKASRSRGISHLSDVAVTALFGASELNTRGLENHVRLPLPSRLDLLAFDASASEVESEITSAAAIATGLLAARLSEEAFLYEVFEEAKTIIFKITGNEDARLRAALAREVKLTRQEVTGYHLWTSAGFDDDADKALKLPKAGTIIHEALTAKPQGAYANLKDPGIRKDFFSVGRPGLIEKITPVDRSWAMAFSLSSGGERANLGRVSVAVTFDGATELGVKVNEVRDALKKLCERWNAV